MTDWSMLMRSTSGCTAGRAPADFEVIAELAIEAVVGVSCS